MFVLVCVDDSDGAEVSLVGVYETHAEAHERMRSEWDEAMRLNGFDDSVEGPYIEDSYATTDTMDEFECWEGGTHWEIFDSDKCK